MRNTLVSEQHNGNLPTQPGVDANPNMFSSSICIHVNVIFYVSLLR